MKLVRFQFVLGVALSALCLWVAFRQVSFSDLRASLKEADYRWLLCYPVLATILNQLRGDIWRLLLRKRASRTEAFWAYGAGFLVNNIFPLRIGEPVRIALLANRRRLPIVEVATAAGLERILDVVFVIAILASTVPFVTGSLEIRQALTLLVALAIFGVVAVTLLIAFSERCDRMVDGGLTAVVPRYAAPLLRRWRELATTLAVVREPSIALRAVSRSCLVWVITIVLQWTVLRGFQPEAGLLDASLVVGLVSIATAIPAAPGGIGVFQWVGQQALALPFPHLYSPATALAAALVSHGAAYVFSSIWGAIGLWYFGVPVGRLTRLKEHGRGQAVVRPEFGASSAID